MGGGGAGHLYGIGGGPHEPFLGAWQRNLRECMGNQSLLAFSAVYACVSVISGDIGKLPLRVWRLLSDGGREEATNHPMTAVLYAPNLYQTHVDFIQQLFVSTLLAGNAYVYLVYDDRNYINEMHVLNPTRVMPLVSPNGLVFYRIAYNDALSQTGADYPGPLTLNADYDPERDGWIVPARNIMHHRVMTVESPLIGVTPLYAAGMSAAVGAKIISQSQSFFANMSRPSGVLSAPGKISTQTASVLKKYWDDNYTSGGGSGKTAVLGDGIKWEPLTMTAIDAQLIEQLRWSVEDVARVFRVPGFLLGDLGKVSYRNSETLMRAYYSGCLQYHIESLEARLDRTFGLKSDVVCEFDLETLLRTDLDVRFTAYRTAIQTGFMTLNEVRARENLSKLKGGDEPLIQVQYQPLSRITAPPAPTAAPVVTPDPKVPSGGGDGGGNAAAGDEIGSSGNDSSKDAVIEMARNVFRLPPRGAAHAASQTGSPAAASSSVSAAS